MLGGSPQGTSFFGVGDTNGNAGNVLVTVGSVASNSFALNTSGNGAAGVLAQSIGGGGGLAGDLGSLQTIAAGTGSGRNNGNGAAVTVTENPGAYIITSGNNAPGILAQSVGGGGGLFVNSAGTAYIGTAGGTGVAGPVNINVYGNVWASGKASPGIYAQSVGGNSTGAVVTVRVFNGATVQGGTDATAGDGSGAGIYIANGASAALGTNGIFVLQGGTVTSVNGVNGTALYSTAGVTNASNSGTITGAINLAGGMCYGCVSGGDVMNTAAGVIRSSSIRLGSGTLTNAGTLDVSGTGTATLQGNYHGTTGTLVVGANFATGAADKLAVTGNVELDPQSSFRVNVSSWQKGGATVLTAGGTLVQDPPSAAATNPAYLFGLQTVQTDGHTLQVQTVSNIKQQAAGLTGNQQGVAAALDRVWSDNNIGAGSAISALAGVAGDKTYRVALNSLAGASVGGVAAAKLAASERFASNMVDCDPNATAFLITVQESCVWLRVEGTLTSMGDSGGQPGYGQSSVTTQLGGQREVAPDWFVGASAGYEASWLSSGDDGSKVTGKTALFGVMAKHLMGPWTFTGALDGGYGWYQSQRAIAVGPVAGIATALPHVGHAGLHFGADYTVPLGDWYVQPRMRVAAVYRGMSSYSESGSTPFNLNVKASDDVVGSLTPMVQMGKIGKLGDVGSLRAFVGFGAGFDINSDWTSQAAFQLDPTATFSARSRLPNAVGKLEAGVDLFTVHGLQGKLSYDASLAPGFSSQSFVGRLAVTF